MRSQVCWRCWLSEYNKHEEGLIMNRVMIYRLANYGFTSATMKNEVTGFVFILHSKISMFP